MKPVRPRFASDDEPSPADRQVRALEDVDRIAQAIYRAECIAKRPVDNMIYAPFNLIGRVKQEQYRSMARQLLTGGVIEVGRRPETGPAPLRGQLGMTDAPLSDTEADLHIEESGRVPKPPRWLR